MIIRHLALDKRLLSEEEATDVIGILSKNQELSENINSNTGTPMIFPLLCQLINGEIDVDRMDYLLRDSYFAGVPYGRFDLDRLINSFLCCVEKNLGQFLLAIDHEGVPSYEDFLLARIHMFYQIYFHKSLGAYRFYLQKAINEKEIDFEIDGSSQNFLFSTETALMEEFKRKRDKKWSGKIYNRIPAKNLIRVIDGDKTRLAKMEEIKTVLSQNGIEVIESYSYNQYSSQIRGEIPNRGTVLVVDRELEQEVIVPLSEKSSLLINRERKIEIFQLYVSREEYDRSIQLIQGVL
jgi:HD superfamily phosphohydrolase